MVKRRNKKIRFVIWKNYSPTLKGAVFGGGALILVTLAFLIGIITLPLVQNFNGPISYIFWLISFATTVVIGPLAFPYFIYYLFCAPIIGSILGEAHCSFPDGAAGYTCSLTATILIYLIGLLLYIITGAFLGWLIGIAGKKGQKK